MSENNNNIDKNENEKKEENIKEGEAKENEKKEEEIKEDDEMKEPLGDKISILHYIDNPYNNYNIESPRSIYAMTQLGFIMDDIVFLSFPEYIDNNPTFRSLPKETQIKRYNFSEQYRMSKIKRINEKIKENYIRKYVYVTDYLWEGYLL